APPPCSRERFRSAARCARATSRAPTGSSAGPGPPDPRHLVPPPAAKPPLASRLWRYQQERFPLVAFVPLISVFTFSSAAYSRVARGVSGFIPWSWFAAGALTALTFFFVLRVLAVLKAEDIDRRARPELPVPRGL